MRVVRILVLLAGLMVSSLASAYVPAPDPHYCRPEKKCTYWVAQNFAPWTSLTARQSELLFAFVDEIHSANDPAAAYASWADVNDTYAATFLAVTRAMSLMTVYLEGGETRLLIDLVVNIDRLEGDRVKFFFDRDAFESWKHAGGKFSWALENGKTETGRFRFGEWSIGGSIHPGYDEQGYTSTAHVPRLQVNYRFADSAADVDLDGYAPWIWGFIPDPLHLTYKNSDVRQWYNRYIKKLGDAGFTVQKQTFQNAQ